MSKINLVFIIYKYTAYQSYTELLSPALVNCSYNYTVYHGCFIHFYHIEKLFTRNKPIVVMALQADRMKLESRNTNSKKKIIKLYIIG